MKNRQNNFFTPFFKTIDRVIFGIKDLKEMEDQPEIREWLPEKQPEEQDDKVAIRSSN
jgi:hypothetical protein